MASKRSPEPIPSPPKKAKLTATPDFNPHLFDKERTAALATEYQSAGPYKHSVVESLFDDELLHRVLAEVNSKGDGGQDGLGGLVGWGMKETDIYKVSLVLFALSSSSHSALMHFDIQINQSFDLSSLSPDHLPQERLDKLPALCQLKKALYSSKFRNWVRDVTGCGPLSQKKVDGSTTRYTKGYVNPSLPL